MALSDERIKAIFIESWGAIPPPALLGTEMVHARAIESEVRKQDEALIRKMLEALDTCDPGLYMGPHDSDKPSYDARMVGASISAARARLQEKAP